MRVTPAFSEQLLNGILHALAEARRAGARISTLPAVTHTPLIADDSNVYYLNAATSGLFVPEIEHWIGVDARRSCSAASSRRTTASVLSEVRSPVDGVLFTLREYPVVYEDR